MVEEEIIIRPAEPDDAQTITHHRCEMFIDIRGEIDPSDLDDMATAYLPLVRQALADGSYLGWLACTASGDIVAGGGLLLYDWIPAPGRPKPSKAYVLDVYTDPTYRRRGIARRIMTEIVDRCRAEGYNRVFLHASTAGRPLYEALGFEQTNEMVLRIPTG
jgi:GNAT superfamily N-acetyltransferase